MYFRIENGTAAVYHGDDMRLSQTTMDGNFGPFSIILTQGDVIVFVATVKEICELSHKAYYGSPENWFFQLVGGGDTYYESGQYFRLWSEDDFKERFTIADPMDIVNCKLRPNKPKSETSMSYAWKQRVR
jgi:hypothetical protein